MKNKDIGDLWGGVDEDIASVDVDVNR